MAKNRSSDNVVIPDISEADPLSVSGTSDHDGERSDGTVLAAGVKSSRLSGDTNGVATVPVSLPVGTLITGTTFNMITPDLTHFKPMLCVDNGFISGGPVNDDMKATHIVIENPPSPAVIGNEGATATPQRSACSKSWEETASMPVLPVRCKNTSAELHKHKFGSGGRGKCIKYGMKWYTPSEFEAFCGRASSKDWKRSIRFGGRSIQALIDEGILTPHATSCTCGACCDDQSAMGPIRLFTPYNRRRKAQSNIDEKKAKIKRSCTIGENDVDSIHQTSNSQSKEAWQFIADGLESNTDHHILENPEANAEQPTGAPDMGVVVKRLDDISQSLVRLAGDLKQCIDDVKVMSTRYEQERATAILAGTVDAHVDAEHAATIDDIESKKCANCNREASAECSLCRRTPYCSTYCQKKDWASHQIECLRTVPTIHNDAQQHQSIMLIVESQHQ